MDGGNNQVLPEYFPITNSVSGEKDGCQGAYSNMIMLVLNHNHFALL